MKDFILADFDFVPQGIITSTRIKICINRARWMVSFKKMIANLRKKSSRNILTKEIQKEVLVSVITNSKEAAHVYILRGLGVLSRLSLRKKLRNIKS
jgi:hypothetical protein